MKKCLSMLLIIAMFVTMYSSTSFAAPEIKIGFIADEKVQTWDENDFGKILLKDGKSFIPLRAISENLGYKVTWDGKTKGITIEKDETKISFKIGDNEIFNENGEPIAIFEAKSFIQDGRTYIPMRVLFMALGRNVGWFTKAETAYILNTNSDTLKCDYYVLVNAEGEKEIKQVLIDKPFVDSYGYLKPDFWQAILSKNVPSDVETYASDTVVMVSQSHVANLHRSYLTIMMGPDKEIRFDIRGWGNPGVKETIKAGLQAVSKTPAGGNEIYDTILSGFSTGQSAKGDNQWAKTADGTQFYIVNIESQVGITIRVKIQ